MPLAEKARKIVKERQAHQGREQPEPDALPVFEPFFRDRLAAYGLDSVLHEMPAVEHRDRQQI